MSVQNYVYEATVEATVADQETRITQLIAASSLRRALVKAEKWMETESMDGAELVSVVKKDDVVI